MKQRNIAIDAIKGLAIIAVALYHFGGGLLPYGYLGVDIVFAYWEFDEAIHRKEVQILAVSNKKNRKAVATCYCSFLFSNWIRLCFDASR